MSQLTPHTPEDPGACFLGVQAIRFEAPAPSPETVRIDQVRAEQERAAEDFVGNLLRCAHVLRGALSEQLGEFGLSEVRCSVLTFLQAAGPNGCSQRALARELCQSESSVSTLVDRMAADGLIKREPAPDDRRRRVLSLTESGCEMLASVNEVRGRRCRVMLEGFSDKELDRSSVLLATMADHLMNRDACQTLPSRPRTDETYAPRRAA